MRARARARKHLSTYPYPVHLRAITDGELLQFLQGNFVTEKALGVCILTENTEYDEEVPEYDCHVQRLTFRKHRDVEHQNANQHENETAYRIGDDRSEEVLVELAIRHGAQAEHLAGKVAPTRIFNPGDIRCPFSSKQKHAWRAAVSAVVVVVSASASVAAAVMPAAAMAAAAIAAAAAAVRALSHADHARAWLSLALRARVRAAPHQAPITSLNHQGL